MMVCSLRSDVEQIKEDMEQYVISYMHPMKEKLDEIFSFFHVMHNKKTFCKAGFAILHERPSSLIIAQHPMLPGYLIKGYLLSSKRTIEENWSNLLHRCQGAGNLRRLIAEKKIRHFIVPEKVIYFTEEGIPVLLVTDMQLAAKQQTEYAWKHLVRCRHIEELYWIISHGYASTALVANIPYTRSGQFACIDTETPYRMPKYTHVPPYLSKKMGRYWNELVQNGEKM